MKPPAMANTPWARLMKPIRPSATGRPTERPHRLRPTAAPSKASLPTAETRSPSGGPPLLLPQLFPGVLHRGAERLELHVHQLAADLAHFAQVLGLDDVARLGIDRDRPARAVRELPALGDFHRAVRVELAFLLLDHLEDERGAVPRTDREEVRRLVRAVLLLPGRDERLVGRPVARRGPVEHGGHAERDVAHVRQLFLG